MQLSKSDSSPIDRLLAGNRWTIGLIFALVLLSYAPALMTGYIWDDEQYVTENVHLQTSEGLWRIWFEPGATPQYYPLVFSTFWVEYQLWGLAPLGYHLTNILLHAANAALLFRILRRLQVPGALFAALLFGVAPIHVESVAWVTERKNVLSGTFYLLAFLAYWRSIDVSSEDESSRLRRGLSYALSLVLFAAALMSKSVTCTLPAAIGLLLWWKQGRLSVRDIVPLIPMFVIGVAAGLNTVQMEKYHVGAEGLDWEWTLLERCLIAGRVLWFYPAKILWPSPLIFIYPKWQIDSSVWWQYGFVVAAVGVIIGLWMARRKLGRGPLTAVLFYAGTLFPALGFIDVYPMRFSFVADHFAYLATIGLIALLAAAIATLVARLEIKMPWPIVGVAIVLLALMRITAVRCLDYMDRETLWIVTIQQNPDCWMANYNIGSIRFKQQRYNEAVPYLRNALRDRVNDEPSREEKGDMHYYLGASLTALGKPEAGIAHIRQATELYRQVAATENPPTPETNNNLGILYGQLQQYDDSIQYFERAVEIDPSQPDANLNLAELYYRLKQYDKSDVCFRAALEADPESLRGHHGLGLLALTRGDRTKAIEHFRKALSINPNYGPSRQTLRSVTGR